MRRPYLRNALLLTMLLTALGAAPATWAATSARTARPEAATPQKPAVEAPQKAKTPPAPVKEKASAPAETPQKPGHIGLLLPLSGPLAPYGHAALRGAMLASELYLEKPPFALTIEVVDSDAANQTVAAAVNKLASEGVLAIIGPLKGDTARAAAPVARSLGIPMIALTPAPDVAGNGVFRLFLREQDEATALARYARNSLGFKRVAVIAPDNAQGKEYRAAFKAAAAANGLEIAHNQTVPADVTSLKEPILAMIGPSKRIDFEAVFYPVSGLAAGRTASQFPFYDLHAVTLLGTRGWDTPTLTEVGKQYVERAVFTAEWHPEIGRGGAFLDAFQEAYGQAPGAMEAYAFDAVRLLVAALADGRVRTRAEVTKLLSSIQEAPAVTGPLTTQPNGDIAHEAKVLTVHERKIIPAQAGQ